MKLKCVPVIKHAKFVQQKQYGLGSLWRCIRISAIFLIMTSPIIPEKALAISIEKGSRIKILRGKPHEGINLRKNLVDPPSTLTGRKLSILHVMQISYAAGFQSEEQLVAATAIAISESGLWSAARNWHPEQGYRPAADPITVEGPSIAWSNGQQIHSDRGIWQFASFWHPQYSDAVVDDPKIAAILAYELSEGGTNFTLWESYSNQSAQVLFDQPFDGWPALRPLVKRFLLKVRPLPQTLEPETSVQQGSAQPLGIR